MVEVYTPPVTISELGTSDHSMALWEPKCSKYVDTGKLIYVTVRCMGPKEKKHLPWLCPPLNGNPYTYLKHARNSTHIIKRSLTH